jgi:hypothetical protein
MQTVGWSRRSWWWVVAAAGPIVQALYSAGLALPAPAWLSDLASPVAHVFQVLGALPILAWLVPAIVFPLLALWDAIARVIHPARSLAVAAWGLSRRSLLALSVAAWVSVAASQPLWWLRDRAVEACVARAEVVVAAIEKYRKLRGAYPAALDDLVPEPFESLPSPGMVAYPRFHYRRADSATRYSGYELAVPMAFGSKGDQLVYWPQQDYPETLYSGLVQRVRGWAYLHE